ncbi:MAG: CinA family protein [Alphaproteobacteria bacterium]|nr:CinA family protein [Alphaproteobacteria bacterium]
MFTPSLLHSAEKLLALCTQKDITIVTAESCTGGLLAGLLTSIAGSSAVFDCGFVTYSNDSKTELLGVPPELIAAHGAVSEEVAADMAAGALEKSNADVAISITGIAGPGGGTDDKPVGLVYIGLEDDTYSHTEKHIFSGDRESVRTQAIARALHLLHEFVSDGHY